MMDLDGKLLTSEKDVEKLTIEVFENRLRNRDMKPELSEMRLKIAEKNKTPPWTLKELEKVSQK